MSSLKRCDTADLWLTALAQYRISFTLFFFLWFCLGGKKYYLAPSNVNGDTTTPTSEVLKK